MELQPQEQCEISSAFAGPVFLLAGFWMCSSYSDCSESYFGAAESPPDIVCDAQDRPLVSAPVSGNMTMMSFSTVYFISFLFYMK